MALSPLQPRDQRVIIADTTPQTSRTYNIFAEEFEYKKSQSVTIIHYKRPTGALEIGDYVDGLDAIRLFVRKTLWTPRFRHVIYSAMYGSELDALVGQDISRELLETEIPRIITESLIYDDRIRSVSNFEITRDNDKVYVSFDVETVEGVLSEGVEL